MFSESAVEYRRLLRGWKTSAPNFEPRASSKRWNAILSGLGKSFYFAHVYSNNGLSLSEKSFQTRFGLRGVRRYAFRHCRSRLLTQPICKPTEQATSRGEERGARGELQDVHLEARCSGLRARKVYEVTLRRQPSPSLASSELSPFRAPEFSSFIDPLRPWLEW